MPVAKINREKERYRLYLCAVDFALGAIAVVLARFVVISTSPHSEPLSRTLWLYVPLIPFWTLSLYLHGQYTFHPRWLGLASVYRNARCVVAGTLTCVALMYFWSRGFGSSRSVYVYATIFASLLFSVDRMLAIKLFPSRVLRERYLLLGTPPPDTEMMHALTNGELPPHVEVPGCIVDEDAPEVVTTASAALSIIGRFNDVDRILAEYEVSHVAVCPDAPRTAGLAHAAARAEAQGVTVERLETVYETLTGRAPVLLAGADWGEGLESVKHRTYMTRYKRIVDVVMTLLTLPFALVLMAVGAAAIKISSPGPVLYRQKRAGKDNREFTFTKLRTMVVDAEKETGPVWATEGDPRVTPVGNVLRKLRLDELPQLFSVLKGDMSLVGPRPERPNFVSEFSETIPFYEKRMLVRPGITGWAQINHGYDQDLDDVVEKLRYDLYYVRHVSFTLDLQVLLRTLSVMLGRRGAL